MSWCEREIGGEILEIIKVFCNNCFGSDAHELTPHVTVYDKAIRENYVSLVREYALKMVVKDNILLQVCVWKGNKIMVKTHIY